MEYIKYYDEIIKRRQSCRSFADKAVGSEVLEEMKAYYEGCPRLLPEVATELCFFEWGAAENLGTSIGYNGFIIKAPMYFAVFSEDADHYVENAGFLAQGLTLKLTQLGLDACWLTINDETEARKALDCGERLKLAAIVAFGYKSAEKKEARLDIVSPSNVKLVKSENKVAPKISLDDLLFAGVYGEKLNRERLYTELEDSLLAVSAAQSFFNRQPYRIIVDDDLVSLIGIPDEMTNDSDRYLNYGIAMFNFYAVMDALRANAPMWSFEETGRDLKLPAGCLYVAKCRI